MPKVEITINRRKSSKAADRTSRGPLNRRREPEHLPRRKAGDVYLRFFDLGQWWNGSAWEEHDFVVSPNMSTDAFGDTRIDNLTSANLTSFTTQVLDEIDAVGLSAFRELTYTDAEKYGLDFYYGANFGPFESDKYLPVARAGSRKWVRDASTAAAGTRWTEDGLKIPRGTATFQLWANSAFPSHRSLNSQMKITSSPTYASPSVPFTFSANANIYIMPALQNEFGLAQIGAVAKLRILNALYVPFPRSFFLGRTFNVTDPTNAHTNSGNVLQYAGTVDPAPDGDMSDLLALMKARPQARVFNTQTNSFNALSSFPNISVGWPGGAWDGGYGFRASSAYFIVTAANAFVPAGTLIAIIQRGTDVFYAWHDGSTFAPARISFRHGGGGF